MYYVLHARHIFHNLQFAPPAIVSLLLATLLPLLSTSIRNIIIKRVPTKPHTTASTPHRVVTTHNSRRQLPVSISVLVLYVSICADR